MQIFRDSATGTARKLDERGIQRRHGEENDVGNINEDVHEANGPHGEQQQGNLCHRLGTMQPHDAVQARIFGALQHEEHRM